MSDKGGNISRNNPSAGLGLWGPLVPASDCKPCLATLATIQLGAGAWLWLRPGRRPPFGRSVGLNRLLKIGGILSGSYLILTAGLEYARLALPYDPWVEDSRKARQSAAQVSKAAYIKEFSWRSPRSWWYTWFGPPGYVPVSWPEWQARTKTYLEKSEVAKADLDGLSKLHATLAEANRGTASVILDKIYSNEFPIPEVPVEELEALAAFPDLGDEDDLFDDIEIQNADLWDFFQEANAFSVIVVPRSTTAFLQGVKIKDEGGLKSQQVNYLPIPQAVKTKLR